MFDVPSLSFIVNGLLGLSMYFMKTTHDQAKEVIHRLENDVETLKQVTMKKEDFKEFKDELWGRLDKIDDIIVRNSEKLFQTR